MSPKEYPTASVFDRGVAFKNGENKESPFPLSSSKQGCESENSEVKHSTNKAVNLLLIAMYKIQNILLNFCYSG
ncbi:MAG: hypothetical protein IPH58_08465 [Sphingobacteriales bacterium]|nr:hypothetical protein [Sphingobacteriales bacterium]